MKAAQKRKMMVFLMLKLISTTHKRINAAHILHLMIPSPDLCPTAVAIGDWGMNFLHEPCKITTICFNANFNGHGATNSVDLFNAKCIELQSLILFCHEMIRESCDLISLQQ